MGLGSRLREERERLGFSQTEFAEKVGASKKSQIRWEQDESHPDAAALAVWAEAGADVFYIVTGTRASFDSPLGWVQIAAYLADQLAIEGSTDDKRRVRTSAFKSLVATAPTRDEVRLLMDWRKCKEDERRMLSELAAKLAGRVRSKTP